MIEIKCPKCETIHQITPPKRKLRKTHTIVLKCFNCSNMIETKYIYKIDREMGV